MSNLSREADLSSENRAAHSLSLQSFQVREVDDIDTVSVFYSSPQMQWGTLVDMWGDLLPRGAAKDEDFLNAYIRRMRRTGYLLNTHIDKLNAAGFIEVRSRPMLFTTQGSASVGVLIARQGLDLYISWRAFFKTQIDAIRVSWLSVVVFFFIMFLWSTGEGIP